MRRWAASSVKVGQDRGKYKKDLILSILKSTTTKREAREYLMKYGTELLLSGMDSPSQGRSILWNKKALPGQLIDSEVFRSETKMTSPKQLALIRLPTNLSNASYKSMIDSFDALRLLGISIVFLLDDSNECNNRGERDVSYLRSRALDITKAFSSHSARALHVTPLMSAFIKRNGEVTVSDTNHITFPLIQGSIPLVIPTAYNTNLGKYERIDGQVALLTTIIGLDMSKLADVQKIVFIDFLGGIPSIERGRTSHVFINNSQEYSDIVSELHIGFIEPEVRERHLINLSNMRELLLACSSFSETTGIILRPEDMFQKLNELSPVAYNVLTDRPIVSSSLPLSRSRTPQVTTSIIKNGFDVRVLFANDNKAKFESLCEDKSISREQFISMINDSFGRTLKLEYLNRLNSCLDCIIIIGDYDGGAVITREWLSTGQTVPYLDKFAIPKRNQGLPSLADVIFKAMLQAYQDEIIWRSRSLNPVNRWYFERSNGSYSYPSSPWRLFFAGESFNNKISREFSLKISSYWDLIKSIPASFTDA